MSVRSTAAADIRSTDRAAADRPFPEVPGVSHRFVTVRGARFHIAESGSDSGWGTGAPAAAPSAEPIVLLHGLPMHWFAWRKVVAELAGEYRLICLDLRGCGWSEPTRHGYATAALVQDVQAVLDELGLGRVRLLAHESGGWLGFALCLAAPERVSAYLAVNTSHPWPARKGPLPLNAWRFWYTAFWEYPGIGRRVLRYWPGFTRFLLRQWAGRPHRWDEAALSEFVQAYRPKHRARVMEQMLWQFVLHDIPALALGRHRSSRLTVPTLLLAGDRDPVTRLTSAAAVPEHADELEVRIVPGGHLLPETAPEVVAAAARELFGPGARLRARPVAGFAA